MKIKFTTLAQSIFLAFLFNAVNAGADTLMQVYQVAKVNDPLTLKTYAQYQKSEQAITSQQANLLPQINFSMRGGYTKGLHNVTQDTGSPTSKISSKSLDNTNGNAKLALTQQLYNSTYWQNIDIQEKIATQDKATYGYEAQGLLLRTATLYFDVLRAADALKGVKANKRAVKRQLQETKQRFNVGLIAITDVHEAQAEYDRTISEEISAKNALFNAYYGLRELTGHDVLDVKFLNGKTFSPELLEGTVKTWRNKALEYNLNLHSKRIAKDIAKMRIRQAQAGHKPTLVFSADVNSDTEKFIHAVSPARAAFSDKSTANTAITLNVPIYSGGSTSSLTEEARYQYVIASEDLVENFRRTEGQINNGYNNVRASISIISSNIQTVKSSRSALKAVQAGFEVGTRTVVDVLDATRELFQAENKLANSRYDYILAMLTLKHDAGTLLEKDIANVSDGLIASTPDIK